MRRIVFAVLLASLAAAAQAAGLNQNNNSVAVTTGNTYQALAPANNGRQMLEIQNNNTSADNCFINVDGAVAAGNTTATSVTTVNGTTTAAQASILLQPGQAYTRYYPYTPSAAIVGTCATTGDSLYVGIH